jgi:uncharacterized protein (TIGR00255 family)
MTGYAALSFDFEEYSLSIEIRSLNSKFLEIKFKLPFYLEHMEEKLRRVMKGEVKRGKVDVFIRVVAKEQVELRMLRELFSKYGRLLGMIEEETSLSLQPSLSDLIALRYLFNDAEETTHVEIEEEGLEECFRQAVRRFQQSRNEEGLMTRSELKTHLEEIAGVIDSIEEIYPSVVDSYREQLKEKVEELIGSQIDETRLLMEVAVFANKADVSEEISRIKSHVRKMDEVIDAGGTCGRELDFISQELNREINTVGAKVPDYRISEGAVQIKTALEKIKEQVRNIE